jgi:hypothetical protein
VAALHPSYPLRGTALKLPALPSARSGFKSSVQKIILFFIFYNRLGLFKIQSIETAPAPLRVQARAGSLPGAPKNMNKIHFFLDLTQIRVYKYIIIL